MYESVRFLDYGLASFYLPESHSSSDGGGTVGASIDMESSALSRCKLSMYESVGLMVAMLIF